MRQTFKYASGSLNLPCIETLAIEFDSYSGDVVAVPLLDVLMLLLKVPGIGDALRSRLPAGARGSPGAHAGARGGTRVHKGGRGRPLEHEGARG